MDCELIVATECNEQYSKKLESNTRDTFEKVCDPIVGSNYGWSCWNQQESDSWYYVGIIIGILILIIIGACLVYRIYSYTKPLRIDEPIFSMLGKQEIIEFMKK
uniref:Uncharacterized protein LOC113791255 n=1 Tax=Dermatophagoides pteronyssinus TaxID=6956 RepID=A0A6P6XTP2_DERPT|nr:uncharacterized protein LOC113791255 [Dermatophagoides pteronyssinus]